jgi:hypothetical protein
VFRSGVALLVAGMLSGCQTSTPAAPQQEAAIYQCSPSDGEASIPAAAEPRKERRLTVSYDAGGQQALVSVDGGSVNYLSLVPNAKERLYSNAKYAWKNNGAASFFTDIPEVRVYGCARQPATQPAATARQ